MSDKLVTKSNASDTQVPSITGLDLGKIIWFGWMSDFLKNMFRMLTKRYLSLAEKTDCNTKITKIEKKIASCYWFSYYFCFQ